MARITPRMQKLIQTIAAKHGVNLNNRGAYLRLEMEGYMPLVIENIGPHQVSVAHYYRQNGDQIADPDVVFFTGRKLWTPIEITQGMFGTRRCGWLSEDGTALVKFQPESQADLAAFCYLWAGNLSAQGWLEEGICPEGGIELGEEIDLRKDMNPEDISPEDISLEAMILKVMSIEKAMNL